MEVVRLDLKRCNLFEDLASDTLEWRNRTHVATPTELGQNFDNDMIQFMMIIGCGTF